MGHLLNVRRLVSEEFRKEFKRVNGAHPKDESINQLKRYFDLREIQGKVSELLAEKSDPSEINVLRRYHRSNLRYLTKYFTETLSNQLKSSKLSLKEALKEKKVIEIAVKTFKGNPQCKVYH